MEDFNSQLIVYNDIAQQLSFAMTPKGTFVNNTVYFIKGNISTLKYLLCYLNSKVIDWYYRTLSVQLGTKAVRMFSIYVEQLPIPKNNQEGTQPSEYDIIMRYGLTHDEASYINNITH